MIRVTESQFARYQGYLTQLKEQEIAQNKWVEEAAAQGDLAENSEFDTAKLELTKTRKRIATLEDALSDSTIIAPSENPNTVGIGSIIRLRIADTGIPELTAGELFEVVDLSDIVIPGSKVTALSTNSLVGRTLMGKTFTDKNSIVNYTDFNNVPRVIEILETYSQYSDIPEEVLDTTNTPTTTDVEEERGEGDNDSDNS